jgi:hypothetical protein
MLVVLWIAVTASLLALATGGSAQPAGPTRWTGEWRLQHTFSPAAPTRSDAVVYARVATTVVITVPDEVPQPTDGLEVQFMRVCTSNDPNLQTRIVHAPATETDAGDAWQGSFTIPEDSGEPRVWTMWAFYPSADDSGPVQVIQGPFELLVLPTGTEVAGVPSPRAIRPPDCASP